MNSIQELLQECQLESSGQFTVDLAAQARKLVEFQSAEPSLFLLKGIQAAHALRALRITIKLRRDEIVLEFDPRKGSSQGFDFPALFRGQIDEPFHHLRPMLLAAVASDLAEIRLNWSDSGREQVWSWRAGHAQTQDQPAPSFNLPRLRLQLRLPSQAWWKRLRPSPLLTHIHSELVRRCALSPTPVELDGRLINAPLLPQALKAGPWRAERNWLSPRAEPAFCLPSPLHGGAPQIRYQEKTLRGTEGWAYSSLVLCCLEGNIPVENYRVTRVTGDSGRHPDYYDYPEGRVDWQTVLPLGRTLAPEGRQQLPKLKEVSYLLEAQDYLQSVIPSGAWSLPSMRVQRWLGLGQGPGRLHYVQDGILLNSLEGPANVHAVLARPQLKTDLGFLDPVLNQEVHDDLEWAARQGAQLQALLGG
ncbi:hypothetical protein ABS71_19385 [bacterium SCN 62-11]|nr:hypothetical protein [Candidatus Eremiobacteraeota bacterium]ODT57716.1 MAG: hypothetical protein ABS71_19385 [bacterium SCN 62-11]